MIVPQYWAEGRVQHKDSSRQVTVKRFGWSDLSQEDAQAKANVRAVEALQHVLAGESWVRREPKVPYNGADGVPIREEVIARHGDTVITRNIYGALCLNTPNVLFADVDYPEGPPARLTVLMGLLLCVLSVIYIWTSTGRGLGLFAAGVLGSLFLSHLLAMLVFRIYELLAGGPSRRPLRRIRTFSKRHPQWHLRLYQTPAGYRVLVMHDVFDAASPEMAKCFRQLGTDPVYVRMCRHQRCFRARVSPKPWRIGITDKLRPRPGVWPVNPDRLPDRQKWVAAYDAKAGRFASCKFLETLGTTTSTHPDARAVRSIHDELSRANSGLPIA